MRTLTLDKLITALGGAPPAGTMVPVRSVVVDSRQVQPGSVFVALHGEQQDGHRYVADAFARGAAAAIVEQDVTQAAVVDLCPGKGQPDRVGLPLCLLVEDALAALHRAASWWRACFDVRIIAITGSLGKTTTKEWVSSVLAQRYRVLKSKGNYNNEVGLPLTLLELNDNYERVVLEMGTYGPGEITLLTGLARPQVGLVTNVGPVHLERMGTIQHVAQAKAELPQALPAEGVAILNDDDEWVRAMAGQTRARVFTYGLHPGCDLWADEITSHGLEGIRFQFHWTTVEGQAQVIPVRIPLLGRHSVYTALCAAAVGLVEGLSWPEILDGLTAGEQLRLLPRPAIHGALLIDDTYNSSPDSAVAALNLLDELVGRKVAVLGDMLELGACEGEGHHRVGKRAAEVVSLLVTVGPRGRLIAAAALEEGLAPEKVVQVDDNVQAIAYLDASIGTGDMVLIKGSRGMSMEQIVEALTDAPQEKGNEGR